MREGRSGERADEQAHSLSCANACNPYYEHTPWRGVTRAVFSPLRSISRQPIWTGTHNDKFTRRSRDPPGRNVDSSNTNKHDTYKINITPIIRTNYIIMIYAL
jgi:hypothetical protein